jgi:hypothetical protein
MAQRNTARLAIHRRSDEISFLQDQLQNLETELQKHGARSGSASTETELDVKVLARQRDLADELLHTRHIEPLGETLQRRLAMAERVINNLAHSSAKPSDSTSQIYRVTEVERQALVETLNQWWAWLRGV